MVMPHVHHDADVGPAEIQLRTLFAEQFPKASDRAAVGQQQVVIGLTPEFLGFPPGGKRAEPVSHVGGNGFVERAPQGDNVSERLEHEPRVFGEPVHDVAVQEAAAVLQFLRQVPVVQRGVGREAQLQHLVDGALVEVNALLIDPSRAVGHYPRPGKREAVGIDAQAAHHRELLRVFVVIVAGNIRGLSPVYFARGAGKNVPYLSAFAVLERRAFDLRRRGGNAPLEPFREIMSGQFRH